MAGERALIPGDYRLSIGSGQPGMGIPVETAAYHVSRPIPLPK